jgi:hypothetical protein
MHTVIVTLPNAFLYETPSAETVSDEVLSGWMVTVQKRQGDFLEITTDYGYKGWMEASAVRSIGPEECRCQNYDKFSENPMGLSVLCRGMTDVLKEPEVQSAVLSTLFMGSHVFALGRPRDGWQKIKTAEKICGYVPAVSLLYSDMRSAPCSEIRQKILHYAKSYLGVQYRWGGKTHAGIDCSGLAFMSYYMCGIIIYRDAVMMEGYPVRKIPLSQLQPADLLYFPGHVALYLGHGDYIHSTGNLSAFGCTINSLNPYSPVYRKDLAENLTAVGSVFCASEK